MKRSRFSDAQVVSILKEQQGGGATPAASSSLARSPSLVGNGRPWPIASSIGAEIVPSTRVGIAGGDSRSMQ